MSLGAPLIGEGEGPLYLLSPHLMRPRASGGPLGPPLLSFSLINEMSWGVRSAWLTSAASAAATARRATAAAGAAARAAARAAATAAAAATTTEAAGVSFGLLRSSRCKLLQGDCLKQRSLSSLSTSDALAAAAAAAAAAGTQQAPPLPACHLTAAAAAARFGLLRQLHDAAFWRDLGASAECLLEALASGQYTELAQTSINSSSSSSNSSNSSNSSSSSRSNSNISSYACRSSGAASAILSELRGTGQRQQETAGAAAWCIDTRSLQVSLPVLLNSFKQMRVFRVGLFAAAERAALMHLHALSLHAVSVLCCSLAAAAAANAAAPSVSFWLSTGNYCTEAAAAAAAATAAEAKGAAPAAAASCCFYSLPPKLHNAAAAAVAGEGEKTAAKAAAASAAAYFHFVSWCLLLGAFARCGIAHQGLFEAGAPHLCCVLQQHKAHLLMLQQQQQMLLLQQPNNSNSHRYQQIVSPGAFITKAVHAFAVFGYSHARLLRSVCECLSLISFTDEELQTLRQSMARLRHSDPLLEALARTRLGSNSNSSSSSSNNNSSNSSSSKRRGVAHVAR
ncbi:hypothetical protein Emed_005441 [Eimeria media]